MYCRLSISGWFEIQHRFCLVSVWYLIHWTIVWLDWNGVWLALSSWFTLGTIVCAGYYSIPGVIIPVMVIVLITGSGLSCITRFVHLRYASALTMAKTLLNSTLALKNNEEYRLGNHESGILNYSKDSWHGYLGKHRVNVGYMLSQQGCRSGLWLLLCRMSCVRVRWFWRKDFRLLFWDLGVVFDRIWVLGRYYNCRNANKSSFSHLNHKIFSA